MADAPPVSAVSSSEWRAAGMELTVVVPTFNERENIPLLVARLSEGLAEIQWEVVFVDDESPDGTAQIARDLARQDPRVRVIERIGRRGLSSATVEGVLSSAAPFFAVMDADLQHDDTKLGEMLARLRTECLDIVIGSRYVAAEETLGLSRRRRAISLFATRVSRSVLHAELADPMSGFFVMRRATFDGLVHHLSQQGFKILLDIFASSPTPLRFAETPCRFNPRLHGESKLDAMAAWEFGVLIIDKLIGGVVPVQFVMFCMVGGTGLLIHLSVLYLSKALGFDFVVSQCLAVFAAMTSNFFLNNLITYRDRRLRGAGAILKGLLGFYVVCSVGAVANVGVADFVFQRQRAWWISGLAGAMIGVLWNFVASRYMIWRRRAEVGPAGALG